MSKNHRSDAALKRAIKLRWSLSVQHFAVSRPDDIIIALSPRRGDAAALGDDAIAEISLRDIIKKRAPLRGIEGKLRSALRSKKRAKKGRK